MHYGFADRQYRTWNFNDEVLMKIVTAFVVTITIAFILLVSFAYSGFYDVSARSPHSGFTNWLATMTMHASIKRRSREIAVPDLEPR